MKIKTSCCLAVIMSTPLSGYAGSNHAHWGYSGHSGPEYWAELNKEFGTCKSGKRQSPIDIDLSQSVAANLGEIQFDYKAISPEVLNNGHTIQVNYDSSGSGNGNDSGIRVTEGQFELAQFHFHTPSENTVNGKHYAMEMHLVHKNGDGRLAVVGVFFKAGRENAELEKVWSKMPENSGEKKKISGLSVNAAQLLPDNHAYARFNGSLTTPPCSEGVNWYVITEPVEASAEQIDRFSRLIGHNARPVQELNHRFVLGEK
jgi:carbonic anhydrase